MTAPSLPPTNNWPQPAPPADQGASPATEPATLSPPPGEVGSEARTLLPPPSGESPALVTPSLPAAPAVPGYELEGELGRGGMGVVYLARDVRLNRPVALKMLLASDFAAPEALIRFLAEAETVARLRHPNIVQIYEIGRHRPPYLALEFLDGGSLADRVARQILTPRDAAALVETIARAMAFAHRQGIVHRDLKPANVLLATDGTPKITDFGLAKHLDVGPGLTQTNAVLGTPAYMAPEQAAGDNRQVGPAADVHALGAILYELLAGRPPFHGGSPLETLALVIHTEARPLSHYRRDLPRDLATICAKCLEKDPRRRYPGAEALADDLGRFLRGEPITARRVGEVERAWKWARRRPALAGALAAAALFLIVGAAVSAWFAVEANAGRRDAEQEQRRAERAEHAALRENARTLFGNAVTLAEDRGLIGPALLEMLDARHKAPADDAALDAAVRANLAAWLPQVGEVLWSLPPDAYEGDVAGLAFSPDGRQVAAWDRTRAGLFDAATGRPGPGLEGQPEAGRVRRLVRTGFTADSRTLVMGWSLKGEDGSLLGAWDVGTGRPRWPVRTLALAPDALALHPAGTTVALVGGLPPREGGSRGAIVRLDLATGQEVGPRWPLADWGEFLTYSPDGRRLLLKATFPGPQPGPAAPDRQLVLHQIDATTGRPAAPDLGLRPAYETAAYSADGRAVITSGVLRTQWLGPGDRPPRDLVPFEAGLAPGEQVLLAWDNDLNSARPNGWWDVATGGPRGEGLSIAGPVAVSTDGHLLAIGIGTTAQVRRTGQRLARHVERPTDPARALPAAILARRPPAQPAVFSPDRRQVVIPSRRLLWLETANGLPRSTDLRFPGTGQGQACFSPDNRLLAFAAAGGHIAVRDATTGQPLWDRPEPHGSFVWATAFSPDGRTLAVGHNGPIHLWDAPTGEHRRTLAQNDAVGQIAFAPDGRRLAAAVLPDWNFKPGVQLWDPATGRRVGPFHPAQPSGGGVWPRFTPDGRTLLVLDAAGLRRIDVATGQAAGPLLRVPHGATALAFTPAGDRLALGGGDGAVYLLDPAAPPPRLEAAFRHRRPSTVIGLQWQPGGRWLLVQTRAGSVQLWDPDARPPQPVGPPLVFRAPLAGAVFTPDGRAILTATSDGDSRTWPVPIPLEGDLDLIRRQVAARIGLAGPGQAPPPAGLLPPPAEDDELLARDAAQDGHVSAALWHLDRVLAARPGEGPLYLRRAAIQVFAAGEEPAAAPGHLDRAAADLARAADLGHQADLAPWLSHLALEEIAAARWATARWCLDRAIAARAGDWQLHRDRAAVAAKLGQPAARAADLEKVLELAPPAAVAALAEAAAREGQWAEAARRFGVAAQRGPLQVETAYTHGLACLMAGDRAGHRAVCGDLWRRAAAARPADPDLVNNVISLATLSPEGFADWQPALGAMERQFAGLEAAKAKADAAHQDQWRQTRHAWLNTHGAALLRAGQAAAAVARLDQAVAAHGQGGEPSDWLFLALAHHTLGHQDQARQWGDKARVAAGPEGDFSWGTVELDVLRREVAALLKGE